jgi:hypothetical protein
VYNDFFCNVFVVFLSCGWGIVLTVVDWFDILEDMWLVYELPVWQASPLGSLHTWRSTDKHEVDFILDESWAIEVKAKTHITKSDLKGLRALKEEQACARYSVVCLCDAPQVLDDGIEVLPYGAFLKEVWAKNEP